MKYSYRLIEVKPIEYKKLCYIFNRFSHLKNSWKHKALKPKKPPRNERSGFSCNIKVINELCVSIKHNRHNEH
jgi:hypothetical protein